LVGVFFGFKSSDLSAQEPTWDFFRGPNFDGHVDGGKLADAWPDAGPPVLWTRKLGQGFSSFTGRGDRVFSQYQTVTSQFVVCLDANTGETVWEYRYDWSYETAGLYPGPRSTPTLDGDRLYFTSPAGVLGCLSQDSGELLWQVDLIKQFDAEPVGFGYSCSPVIVGEKLIVPAGGEGSAVVAFDKMDGSVIWQAGDFKISYASVLPIERNGQQLLVAFLQNALVLMATDTGEVFAQLPLSSGYDEHSAWPIYSEPNLWISAPFKQGCQLLRVTDDDRPELKSVWHSKLLSNDVCSSVLVDEHLFGFDINDVQSKVHRPSRGSFRCLEFATGKPIWQNGSKRERHSLDPKRGTAAADSVGHCSVLYADGKLILFNDMGDLMIAKADAESFELMGKVRVLGGEVCWTQPMLLGSRLYLRNHSQAVCVYLGDPAELDVGDSLMAIADVPQTANFDWASLVFTVEPEYAMDAPSLGWLVKWYWVMLFAGWGIAFPLATIMSMWIRGPRGQFIRRLLYRVIAIAIGVFGVTLISPLMDDFIFTWPLALAIVFEILVYQMKTRAELKVAGDLRPTSRWPGRFALLLFTATCVAYFYLCRRLSLAFEWSFLLGFPAAVPFLMWAKRMVAEGDGFQSKSKSWSGWKWYWEWGLTAVAFSAFYWLGAGVVLWKY
jgi:outer membrane protein assembly factor BamB